MRAPLIWQPYACDDARVELLTRELGLSPVAARLLAIRGLADVDAAPRFLKPSHDHLLDPIGLAHKGPTHERRLRGFAVMSCTSFPSASATDTAFSRQRSNACGPKGYTSLSRSIAGSVAQKPPGALASSTST